MLSSAGELWWVELPERVVLGVAEKMEIAWAW